MSFGRPILALWPVLMFASMWPLLVRDGQALQYFTLTLLWNFVIGYNPLKVEGGFVRVLGLVSTPYVKPCH